MESLYRNTFEARKIKRFIVALIFGGAFIVLLPLMYDALFQEYHRIYNWFAGGFTLFNILFICLIAQGKYKKEAMALFVICISADLFTAHFNLNKKADRGIYDNKPVLLSHFEELKDEPFRFYSDRKNLFKDVKPKNYHEGYFMMKEFLQPNINDLYSLEIPDGLAALEPDMGSAWVSTYEKLSLEHKIKWLINANVKYFFSPQLYQELYWIEKPPGIETFKKVLMEKYGLKLIAKNFFLLKNYRKRIFIADTVAAMEKNDCFTKLLDSKTDLNVSCYEELGKEGRLTSFSRHEESRIISSEFNVNGELSAKVNLKKEEFITNLTTFYPGWECVVDGKKVKMYKTNLFYQGFFVPEGEHLIEINYIPTHYYKIYILFLFPVWAFNVVLLLKRRRLNS
ncbi:MAG: hypothetical protein HQK84_09965 [Nitrospinae bacterium]|nr:hypothetical protein [Nitrospinota bacterium]